MSILSTTPIVLVETLPDPLGDSAHVAIACSESVDGAAANHGMLLSLLPHLELGAAIRERMHRTASKQGRVNGPHALVLQCGGDACSH